MHIVHEATRTRRKKKKKLGKLTATHVRSVRAVFPLEIFKYVSNTMKKLKLKRQICD